MKRFVVTSGIAAVLGVNVVLASALEDAVPASFLVRPVATMLALSLAVAALSSLSGRFAPLVSASGMALLVAPPLATLALVPLLFSLSAWVLRRRSVDLGRPTAVVLLIWLAVLMIQLGPDGLVEPPVPDNADGQRNGPPIYLILVDGYPRQDTLATLGIDATSFLGELESRGFEQYPGATSRHGWTVLTLTALLTGVREDDVTPSPELRRQLRRTWSLPPGWTAIDPPVGHVTIPGATHIDVGGITDLEAHLIGESVLGQTFPRWTRGEVGRALRARHEAELMALATTNARRVFAHILAPHPAFVFGADPTAACWPDACHLFSSAIEATGLTVEEWTAGMDDQVAGLNALLLQTIDDLVSRSPDAVIVLFSDHGGRYSYEERQGEWHRSFLAARTPGHPNLFGSSPHPDEILDVVQTTYGD